ncbi:MAG: di-heme enzyme [Myxococcota bacterium]
MSPLSAASARAVLLVVGLAAPLAPACDDGGAAPDPWLWDLPPGFPEPFVPADNPMNADKVELGRRLFYDKRLSGNGTQACASCHIQAHGFAEPKAVSVGSTGEAHFRNAMGLTNAAYNSVQTWANPLHVFLEEQATPPMFGETPVELGLAGKEVEVVQRFQSDPDYAERFALAFPDGDGRVTIDRITMAIGAFERTLISGQSAYDKFWYQHDPSAMSESALRGMDLFFSERLECFHCHAGFDFASSVTSAGKPFAEIAYHNTGLYNLDGQGAYPAIDQGLYKVTHDPADMGRFKAPTLRNIMVTAPYMHDGSIADIDGVLDHYAAGGRTIADGPDAGVGSASPLKKAFVKGFSLTPDERADLKAFLAALTDEAFLADPRFADPFAAAP